ncbi:hypothetical protein RFI_32813 [Reticulomyxa filosa]|uniref:Uncharacterized protein n=1 Tax=Reticulomyxa filosa TaxID=46433 RepID=X6LSG7_RETFI|nr:hypothetical protein RFI_32813 [Reticulomyxa filosa]|eukprot:ETO04584.1 hypothetical protein RFI_32813 [Reticulomyxa filosa]
MHFSLIFKMKQHQSRFKMNSIAKKTILQPKKFGSRMRLVSSPKNSTLIGVTQKKNKIALSKFFVKSSFHVGSFYFCIPTHSKSIAYFNDSSFFQSAFGWSVKKILQFFWSLSIKGASGKWQQMLQRNSFAFLNKAAKIGLEKSENKPTIPKTKKYHPKPTPKKNLMRIELNYNRKGVVKKTGIRQSKFFKFCNKQKIAFYSTSRDVRTLIYFISKCFLCFFIQENIKKQMVLIITCFKLIETMKKRVV